MKCNVGHKSFPQLVQLARKRPTRLSQLIKTAIAGELTLLCIGKSLLLPLANLLRQHINLLLYCYPPFFLHRPSMAHVKLDQLFHSTFIVILSAGSTNFFSDANKGGTRIDQRNIKKFTVVDPSGFFSESFGRARASWVLVLPCWRCKTN